MALSLLSVIYFIAFSHAFMLAIVLWRRSATLQSGRLLSVMLAIMAYTLFEGGAVYSGLYRYVPHLMNLMPYMVLTLGPVFYAYVRRMTGDPPFRLVDWALHLVPFVGMWFYVNSDFILLSGAEKVALYDRSASSAGGIVVLPTAIVIRLLAIKVILAGYLYASWKKLNLFAHSAENLRSDNSGDIIKQLRLLAISFILLEALWVGLFLAQQYAGIGTLSLVSQGWLLFIAVIVLAMGFAGLQNPQIVFTQEERLLTEAGQTNAKATSGAQETDEKVKYLYSALPESTTHEIARMIEKSLEEDQLYLDDKLSLTDLSKKLDMKSHTLSQVINQGLETNFYKLINSYRVQHAVGLLDDPKLHWPIERIALESGFSNRVTFNKAFKEQMNCTASEYKKKARNKAVS
ncbi:hypothetical protein GCM10017044_12250 [Kordiimonas sediminis]|uniref:HTH araC/xylS-type domain-containing protein n=1 Tax=Kordiimonas sediminis TaxID=1735581 RepID=A0A919E4P2_9PROT|nr:AraC family transcriptional regulator [Kordiimonas sediminis]GHF19245.1 hypothetical protein GCM10017044_12250 [Kordiimonas sediminis]